MSEMPKVLGADAQERGSDDFARYVYETPAGTVQLVQYGPYNIRMWRGEWFPAGPDSRRFEIGLHTKPAAVAEQIDALLRVLCAHIVEPIAAKLDGRRALYHQRALEAQDDCEADAAEYFGARNEAQNCADIVRDFWRAD